MSNNDPIDLVSSSDEEERKNASKSSKRKIQSRHETQESLKRTKNIDKIRKETENATTITSSLATFDSKKRSHDEACDSSGNSVHQQFNRVKIPFSTDSEVLTCSRCPPILACSCDQRTSNKVMHVYHIQQHDKWSCGFRNTQMILSSILSDLPSDHLLLRNVESKTIPSIEELQTFMELAWKDGFDPTGCKHFKGKIIGKQSKVGAMEISSVLSFLRLDCAVVQFIVCDESRSLLGPFVWEYFLRRNGCQSCSICRTEPSSCVSLARDLLEWTGKGPNYANETCHHPVQPLYLQWEGHSVTIVGIERCEAAYNLIVFDPMRRWISTHDHESTWFQHLRLSTQVTQSKDCQIVMCSAMHLDKAEWTRRKGDETCHVVTAAHEIVQRKISLENKR